MIFHKKIKWEYPRNSQLLYNREKTMQKYKELDMSVVTFYVQILRHLLNLGQKNFANQRLEW